VTVQDVDPETFYLVGKRLFELAGDMYDAFEVNVKILAETGAMAGSDDAGTAWATSYDQRVGEVLGAVDDLTVAMENYGGVVIQAGYNHAIAEHNATLGAGAPPVKPPEPASVAGVLSAPPSAGGPGKGLVDDALGLVGVPVPDGSVGDGGLVRQLRGRRGCRHRQNRTHHQQVRQDHQHGCNQLEDFQEHQQGCQEGARHRRHPPTPPTHQKPREARG
jgi:hypothetical protein